MSRVRHTAAVGLLVVTLGAVAVGAFLAVTSPASAHDLSAGDRLAPLTMVMFACVGGVLTLRRPHLPIGWILVAFATLQTASGTGELVARRGGPSAWSFELLTWVQSWVWVPAITLLAIGLLLFPDGRLPSRRWRHVLRLEFAALAGAVVLGAVLWSHRGQLLLDVAEEWPGAAGAIGSVLLPSSFVGFIAALASLVVRYRTAGQIVRLQLKWLLLAVTLLVSALLLAMVSDVFGLGQQWWQDVLGISGLFFLPVGIGLAVLKYRLYEIDRIISRTLSYVLLTGVLVAVYAAGVLGVGALLPGEPSDLLVAGSTLVVAALFRPLRSRIQAGVDSRFNRSRYDAARTGEAFGARLRDEVDVASVVADLRGVVGTAVEPRVASVWLRS